MLYTCKRDTETLTKSRCSQPWACARPCFANSDLNLRFHVLTKVLASLLWPSADTTFMSITVLHINSWASRMSKIRSFFRLNIAFVPLAAVILYTAYLQPSHLKRWRRMNVNAHMLGSCRDTACVFVCLQTLRMKWKHLGGRGSSCARRSGTADGSGQTRRCRGGRWCDSFLFPSSLTRLSFQRPQQLRVKMHPPLKD